LSAIGVHIDASVARREWGEADFSNANFLESGIEGFEALQGSKEKACGLQQDERDGDLRDDERLAEESCATADGSLALA
jgi:hypothetical protein